MTVRREVAVSALLSTVAAACIGIGGFWAARTVATDEAIHQAQAGTELLASSVITPAVSEGLATGDPSAVDQLDEIIGASVLSDRIVAAKVWRDDGTVLYSDDLEGIGSRFPLGDDQQEVFSTGEAHAELSNLSKDENADQSDFDQLLEVYVAIEDPEGTRLLFETYQSTAGIDASTQRILRAFAPVVLGGLLLFGAIQALLSWRLARRLQRSQDERERLLAQSLAASDHERRTIAADLHDGVVQDLVGVTYSLDALAAEDAPHSRELSAASMSTRRSVRSLRSLLVEIYPPNLSQVGLAGAVADLVAAAPSDVDIDTRIDSADRPVGAHPGGCVPSHPRGAVEHPAARAGLACRYPAGERRSGNRRPDGHRRRRRIRSSRRGGGACGPAPAGRPRALPGRDAHDHLISGEQGPRSG